MLPPHHLPFDCSAYARGDYDHGYAADDDDFDANASVMNIDLMDYVKDIPAH